MINYKGTPLLGEDSNPQHTSEFFAIAGTVLFWLIFSIFSFVIKPQPEKPKYKEVQIVLSSTPVVQKTEEAPAPAEAASASAASSESVVEQVVETPVVETPAPKVEKAPVVKETPLAPKPVEKKVETPKPKAQPKPEPKKEAPKAQTQKTQTPAPANKVEPVETPIYKSNDELLAEQLSKTRKRDENYDPFANDKDDNENSTISDSPKVVITQNTIAGEAAKASSNDSSSIKSSSSQKDTNNYDVTAGKEFDKIRDAKELGKSDSGNGNNPNKSNSTDKNSISWEGASSRSVYSFDTELSQKAKSSMQVSKPTPFTITFSVDADGNVMATTIVIKNEFILSEIIMKEMKEKISSWKFGKGSGISKARFDWILSPGN